MDWDPSSRSSICPSVAALAPGAAHRPTASGRPMTIFVGRGVIAGGARSFLFLTLACQPSLFAQSLRLSSASAARGDLAAIEISLESPAGKEPLALQWEAQIPMGRMSLIGGKPVLSPTAEEAGKSLNCAVTGKTAETQTLRCILAGGQKPIPNGSIAMLKLKIAQHAQTGSAHIRVQQGLAVSKDLKQISLDAVDTVVTIR